MRAAAALMLALALAPGPAALALPGDRDLPIEVEADRAVRDERRGFTTYTGRVVLTQGSLVIEADRLTIFHGTDVAERVVALGEPARMRQQPEADEPLVRAAARRITYLTADERVLLEEEARVEQDGATVTGNRIDYLIPEQLVRADAEDGDGERVQVVIPARVAAEAEGDGGGEGSDDDGQEEPAGGAAESD